ncbi:hypothetical protein ACLOJK_024901 [Asimina triloba]
MKIAPLRSLSAPLCRSFSLWSMKKDPALESALSRNRRWIVNNQLKNIILRCPDHVAPVQLIQKKFKTLDLQGQALNWLKKYPCCFDVYLKDDEYYCKLTKRMMALVEEEESVKDGLESVLVEKLAKLLMMSSNKRLNVIKLNELKRSFGFPDDYLVRILPKYPEMFRTVNWGIGKRSTMDIELVSWQPNFAISKVEASARGRNTEPRFECFLPSSWEKSWDRFLKFNETPYISPYSNGRCLEEGPMETEKRVVGVVHELLSLTLWKKASIMKLGHFQREFGFPEKLNLLLLRHPGIFYVSNKYQIYTVVLREGYRGSELTDKDPLVVVKDKFGELMQEGLHEYNQRRRVLNLEKKKKGLMVMKAEGKQRRKAGRTYEQDEEHEEQGEIYKPEERKRRAMELCEESLPSGIPRLLDGTFYLWETNTWTSDPWSSSGGCVTGAAWDPDGNMILLSFSDSMTLGSIHFASKPPSFDAHLLPVDWPEVESLTGRHCSYCGESSARVSGFAMIFHNCGIEKMAWDASGERLALSYQGSNEIYSGLVAVYDVRRMPLVSASLIAGAVAGAVHILFYFEHTFFLDKGSVFSTIKHFLLNATIIRGSASCHHSPLFSAIGSSLWQVLALVSYPARAEIVIDHCSETEHLLSSRAASFAFCEAGREDGKGFGS